MRTTLNLNDQKIAEAMKATGIHEKTSLIHHALDLVLQEQARQNLIKMHGIYKHASAPRRRRFS